MKTREFDIKNYDVKNKIIKDYNDQYAVIEFKGITIENYANMYNIKNRDSIKLEDFDLDYQEEIKNFFLETYEEKKETTIKNFEKVNKFVKSILFDDKDYLELIEVLDDNYYCQATTLLNQLLETKIKGKSGKALKYQARVQQYNNISCD